MRQAAMGPMATTHPNRPVMLVIEDDHLVRHAMQLILEEWSFDVVAAASEDDAITLLGIGGRRPDGIIADYRLSRGRTGTEAIAAIRRLYPDPIPGVILTGDWEVNETGTAERWLVLQKPVKAPHLHDVLSRMVVGPTDPCRQKHRRRPRGPAPGRTG